MTCLPTTREGYLAAIGRFIFETRIEPMSRELAANKSGGNPFDSKSKVERPTVESAMAAVVARVREKEASDDVPIHNRSGVQHSR